MHCLNGICVLAERPLRTPSTPCVHPQRHVIPNPRTKLHAATYTRLHTQSKTIPHLATELCLQAAAPVVLDALPGLCSMLQHLKFSRNVTMLMFICSFVLIVCRVLLLIWDGFCCPRSFHVYCTTN